MPRAATRRETLTKRSIEQLEPQAERYRVADSKAVGLAIVVQPTGRKTWELYRSVAGRPTRITLGQFPALTCEQARAMAAEHGVALAKGEDPNAVKRRKRQEPDLQDLFDAFMEHHSRPRKKWSKTDEKLFERHLSAWKARRLSSIDYADVVAWHKTIGEQSGKYAANRALALLSTMFNKGGRLVGWTGENPARGVEKFREQSRDRFLQPDELPTWAAAVAQEPDPWPDYFWLAVLTGARRWNLFEMAWEEIDFTTAVWRIPLTKSGESLRVPLSDPAIKILAARRQRQEAAGQLGRYVFPGGRKGVEHLVEAGPAWRRVVKRAGLPGLRLHDLRRTLGSWQAALGSSLPVIGRSLGHKQTQTTAIYARLNIDPVRNSVAAAGAALIQAAQAKPEVEIVKLLPASTGKPTTEGRPRRAK